MKKLIIILIFFLFIFRNNEEVNMVMNMSTNINYYLLDFSNENLNMRNFKLKMALFSSNSSRIMRVYMNYPNDLKDTIKNKEYFSFDNSNYNDGINMILNEYRETLKNNYLYDEMEKDINNITINRVYVYAGRDVLTNFQIKYPNVIIKMVPAENIDKK